MDFLRYTLVSDGSSDRQLMPILDWLLRTTGAVRSVNSEWADLSSIEKPKGLTIRLKRALDLYPCDVLFVHRDAEKQEAALRFEEIRNALSEIHSATLPPAVCVVPVRMQEAWLLFDEKAIRHAAGNPNGTEALNLPKLTAVEAIPDPKAVLHEMLRKACGLSGRRLKKFSASRATSFVTHYTTDFSKLRAIPAFQRLESDIVELRDRGWRS